MSEIISPDNTELLSCILMDVKNRSYIDVVRDVQQQLSSSPDQVEVPIQHHFAPGVYMRQMDAMSWMRMNPRKIVCLNWYLIIHRTELLRNWLTTLR